VHSLVQDQTCFFVESLTAPFAAHFVDDVALKLALALLVVCVVL
jgi:hypothetical protein